MTADFLTCPNGHRSPARQHFCGQCGALLIAPRPEADWYPDPDDVYGERYWDGQRWTNQRRPRGEPILRIDGSILSVTGVSGIVTGECAVLFDRDLVTSCLGTHPTNSDSTTQISLHCRSGVADTW